MPLCRMFFVECNKSVGSLIADSSNFWCSTSSTFYILYILYIYIYIIQVVTPMQSL